MRLQTCLGTAVLAFLTIGAFSARADSLNGQVVDCNNNPISGLEVDIWKVMGDDEENIDTVKTDARGVFDLQVNRGKYYALVACPCGDSKPSRGFANIPDGPNTLFIKCCCKAGLRSSSLDGDAPGMEGKWILKTPASGNVLMTLQDGAMQITMNRNGRMVSGRGIYRRVNFRSADTSNSFTAIFQLDNIPGVHYLIAEIESCGPLAGGKIRGISSSFATPKQAAGTFTGYLQTPPAVLSR